MHEEKAGMQLEPALNLSQANWDSNLFIRGTQRLKQQSHYKKGNSICCRSLLRGMCCASLCAVWARSLWAVNLCSGSSSNSQTSQNPGRYCSFKKRKKREGNRFFFSIFQCINTQVEELYLFAIHLDARYSRLLGKKGRKKKPTPLVKNWKHNLSAGMKLQQMARFSTGSCSF